MKDLNIKTGRTTLIVALSIIAALLVFKLGVFVGFQKAQFSFGADDRRGPMGMPFPFDKDITGGHGAAGRVVGVSLPNFIVASPDNFEKTVFVGSSTMIRKFRNSVGPQAINVDDFVSVLGNPTASGSIDAKLIRIMQ